MANFNSKKKRSAKDPDEACNPSSSNGKRSARSRKTAKRDWKDNASRSSKSSAGTTSAGKSAIDPASALNDLSWYSRYPNLLSAAASIPYPYRPGMQLPLGPIDITGTVSIDNAGTWTFPVFNNTPTLTTPIPGVLGLDWAPSVGLSLGPTDPASLVGKEIYAKVRAVYSGSLEADAPDYVIYLMALDSIFAYIGALKRIYRCLNSWTPDNYILPDTMLDALGVGATNAVNLRQEKTLLFGYINELVYQSRRFHCPAEFDVMRRHYWMNDNVYTDADSINSQFYIFKMTHAYQFNASQTIQGQSVPAGGLTSTQISYNMSAVDLYTTGIGMIKALDEWDDSYTINGYLKRAFDGSPEFFVEELRIDEKLVPVYAPEVLMQIENSRAISPGMYNRYSNSVGQDPATNSIISMPSMSVANTVGLNSYSNFDTDGGARALISVRSDTPSVGDSVIATRLQALPVSRVTSNPVSGLACVSISCGTEVPIAWKLTTFDNATSEISNTTIPTVNTVMMALRGSSAGVTTAEFVGDYSNFQILFKTIRAAQFDWHPFFYLIWKASNSSSDPWVAEIFGDYHNATTVDVLTLQQMHKVCLLSEFNAFSV